MAEFIIGFTGSRNGLTQEQKDFIHATINELNPDEVHHGDCVGADALFHQIVRLIDPNIRIVIHPGNIPKLRAHCKGDEVLPAKDPLERNRDIVDGCDILVRRVWRFNLWGESPLYACMRGVRVRGKVDAARPS